MRRNFWRYGLLLFVLKACDCQTVTPPAPPVPDAGNNTNILDSGGIDRAFAQDASASFTPPASGLAPVGGGGVSSSPSFQLRLNIGAPQPMGQAQGAAQKLKLGAPLAPEQKQ